MSRKKPAPPPEPELPLLHLSRGSRGLLIPLSDAELGFIVPEVNAFHLGDAKAQERLWRLLEMPPGNHSAWAVEGNAAGVKVAVAYGAPFITFDTQGPRWPYGSGNAPTHGGRTLALRAVDRARISSLLAFDSAIRGGDGSRALLLIARVLGRMTESEDALMEVSVRLAGDDPAPVHAALNEVLRRRGLPCGPESSAC